MGLTKHIYCIQDLEEQDIASAPSLDLPDIEVEKYFLPKDNGRYMLLFANTRKDIYPKECPYCGATDTMKRAGNGQRRLIHDVVRNNFRVDIALLPKRFECTKCGAKTTPTLRGIEDKRQMTTRLFEFLQTECFLQSHTALAERSGFSVESIQNIMDEEIEKYENERRAHPLPAPRVLGIDEKHITRLMRGTLVDVESGLLLDMLEDNRAQTMKEAIMRLVNWNVNIEVITTDMNNSYLIWLSKFLPNATIVIDKFHIIQDIQRRISTAKKSLYKYRKELIRGIEDGEEKTRQMTILNLLNKNQRLFNYSMETLVRDDSSSKIMDLSVIIEEFPEFRLLRKLFYLIELMYLQESYQDAEAIWDEWQKVLPPGGEKQYHEWCDFYSVQPPLFDEFRSFTKTNFLFFKPYILNYFRPGCRFTNAVTEGLNNLIERINRDGNGLSFKSLRAKSLYASLIHERRQYGIDVKTIK